MFLYLSEGGGYGEGEHGEDFLKAVNLKYRVESRPDLGFTTKDKPYPRGELLILSEAMSHAEDWFGSDDTVTIQKKKYASDGYYYTGDIVEWRPDSNSFRIIDRGSSVVKLSNGLFFSPFKVEAAIGDLSNFGVSDHIITSSQRGEIILLLETAMSRAAELGSDEVAQILSETQRRCFSSGLPPASIPHHVLADFDHRI